VHSSIGVPPSSVTEANEQAVWDYQYVTKAYNYKKLFQKALRAERRKKRARPFKYSVGDRVRVAYFRRKNFHRSYDQQFGAEIFTIHERKLLNDGVATYYLRDYDNEKVLGPFYTSNLTAVKPDKDALYRIEKVVKTRIRNGVEESLLRFEGWSPKYDKWEPTAMIKNLGRKKKK
jgi:hypothetical protein